MLIKEHPVYTNYLITTNGDVISKNYNRTDKKGLLKQEKQYKGYLVVSLSKNNIFKTLKVHRLVAQTFITNLENKPEVNHKDGVKTNNRVDNLEWCTSSENHLHAFRMGLCKTQRPLLGRLGKLNHCSKPVHQIDIVTGKIIKTWDCAADAARFYNKDESGIAHVCRGNTKTAYGFKWKKVD